MPIPARPWVANRANLIQLKFQIAFADIVTNWCGCDLEMVMGKFVFALTTATLILPSGGHAQATLDMTQVTCANYLAMSPDQARIFSAWMSGWYNQKFGYTTVGFDDFGRNVASVRQWCAGNPQATIMAALDRSAPQAGPPTGQIKVDMSLVTCKQFLSLDADRQDMIAYWMSGFFRAYKSQPIFDFQRFANNIKKLLPTIVRNVEVRPS